MLKLEFHVVNSFASKPFGGNPAAVFPYAEGLSQATMQSIARQLNLVETVFVFPCDSNNADFNFRFFTPAEELPVAGHPSIAAWLVLAREGIVQINETGTFFQETRAGIQEITVQRDDIDFSVTMKQPVPRFLGTMDSIELAANVLGLKTDDISPNLPVQAIDSGLGHLIVPLKSLQALKRVKRNTEPLRIMCKKHGVREVQAFCFETYDSDSDLHTRNVCPRDGIEDPACGVGNGALGYYLLANHFMDEDAVQLTVEQGIFVDKPSVVQVKVNRMESGELQAFVGGSGIEMLRGEFSIDW